jgi:hypothetical protein
MSRARIAAALCLPALLVGATACGAATTSTASGTAAQASAQTDRWDEKTLVPAMKAAIDKQESAHVTLRSTGGPDGSGAKMNVEGDLSLAGTKPDMVFTTDRTPFGGPAEMRMVDGVVYVSVPPMTPEGKFLEIRPGDKSSPFGQMLGEMEQATPEDAFKAFEQGLRDVRYVGEDTVRGEQLAHYRLTLDPRAAARAEGGPDSNGMPHSGRVPREATVDVWLDGDALVHRVRIDKARQGSAVVDLTDWGKPVTVEAPQRSDIVKEISGLPGMMPGTTGS